MWRSRTDARICRRWIAESWRGLRARRVLIRLAVGGEMIMQSASPVLTVGGVEVEPPAGIFLQAVPEAEAMIIELVMKALPKRAKSVADLFSRHRHADVSAGAAGGSHGLR